MPELSITKVEKGKGKKKCSRQLCCGCWTKADKKISDPWPGNILHHGFVFALLGLDLNILLHLVHVRKKRKDRKYSEWMFFCSCLGKMHLFQGWKTHIYPCWGGKAARKKDKTTKDLQQYCGDNFYLFPPLYPAHCQRPEEKRACEGPYGVITGDSLCCALSRGLSWQDHAVQEHNHLTHEVRAPRGSPLLPPHSALPRKATLESSAWDPAVPKEVTLSRLLLSTSCAAHLFQHLSACCHSVQQIGEVTCVKITLSSTKTNSYF